jgi:hypothetical protein
MTPAGNAVLLVTSARNDIAFMRLPPHPANVNLFYLGWTSAAPMPNETLTSIQHPGGDFTRISFGNLVAHDLNFWTVQWFAGVTEPGSSGSPLINSAHLVIGQLYGGESACDNPSGLDDFGRFDVTFSQVQKYLNPVKGTFTGLFAATNPPTPQSSGSLSLTATAKGTYTGYVQLGSVRSPFHGQFDSAGSSQTTVKGRNLGTATLQLQLGLTNDASYLAGTLTTPNWIAQVFANHTFFDGKSNIAQQMGKYTMIIPGNDAAAAQPGGDSFGTVSVDKAGRVHLVASLADGTKFSQSAVLSQYTQWPLYAPLYAGQGMVWSWMTFSNALQGDLSGDLTWFKPNVGKAKLYNGGFSVETNAWGLEYVKPGPGANPVGLSSGTIIFSGGGLSQAVTNQITFSGNRGVGADGTRLNLNPATGTFAGRFPTQSTPPSFAFSGVALQSSNAASGFFVGSSQSGRVRIAP